MSVAWVWERPQCDRGRQRPRSLHRRGGSMPGRLRSRLARSWLVPLCLAAGLVAPAAASADPTSAACDARANNSADKLLPCIQTKDLWNHMKAFQAIADMNPGLDGHPSRNSGEPGYFESAQYVKRKMEAAGYNVKLQPYTFTYTSFVGTPTWSESSPTSRNFPLVDDWVPGSGNGTVPDGQVEPAGGIVIPPTATSSSTSGCTPAAFSGFTAGHVALIQRG